MFGMMEGIFSFIRRQVGLRTDAADENGSLHAKVADVKSDTTVIKNNITVSLVASNTVRAEALAQVGGKYGRDKDHFVKGCVIHAGGSVRVKGEVFCSISNGGVAIRVNGGERYRKAVSSSDTFTAFSCDIPVPANSIIEFCVWHNSTSSFPEDCYLRNLRVCYDVVTRSGYSQFV